MSQVFIQTLQNPEKVKVFIQILNWAFYDLFWSVFWFILIVWVILFIYQVYKKTKSGQKKQQVNSLEIIKIAGEMVQKSKQLGKSILYLFIGGVLQFFNWKLVSLSFELFSQKKDLDTLGTKINIPEMDLMFANWSILSLFIFSFAPFFIAFCFGNKFIRNIWILIYVLWIAFVALGYFLNLGLYA